MYFIPVGLLITSDASFLAAIGKSVGDYPSLTWTNFLFVNLLPVTIGNILGGVVLVGVTYWFVYLRSEVRTAPSLQAMRHENEPSSALLKTD
jgi:formate/nitrite transporter FocA (FNT family)